MHSQALRIFIAVVAVAVIVAVLSILVVESRSVTNEHFISHAERMRAIELSEADIGAVRAGVETAFRNGDVPPPLELALVRLSENSRRLQELSDTVPVDGDLAERLDSYVLAVATFADDGRAFIERQNGLAADLADLQRESPELVKYLRDQGLPDQAQQVFTLAIDILEYAGGSSSADADSLALRIDALAGETYATAEAGERIRRFAAAAEKPLLMRAGAEAALEPVLASGIGAELGSLRRSLVLANGEIVSRAERARLLLAVCAVILLAGTAYAIVRLQFSYRELNQANVRLEERVQERTEQLSNAYSELKESQVQLIHAEKMSSLGEMVAGISHEINTPLWYLMNNSSTIQERLDVVGRLCDVADSMLEAVRTRKDVNQTVSRGLVEMNRLMNDGIKDDIEEAKDLIQDSIDGLDDLTTLAQGLKDFSRLDRAQKGEFDVNEGLDRTLLIAKNKLKNKATIYKHYGDVPQVHCSPSQINQVFLNLLTNAADAIPDHGEIVVHTGETDGVVEISISDNGTGIPNELLSKIRNPFFTTKDVGKGTGLGLSIVDRIVTEHGGELRVESEVGRGTTVTVALPVGEPDEPGEESADRTSLDIEPAVMHQQQTATPQHVGTSLSA